MAAVVVVVVDDADAELFSEQALSFQPGCLGLSFPTTGAAWGSKVLSTSRHTKIEHCYPP